jgi:hypothetical protein
MRAVRLVERSGPGGVALGSAVEPARWPGELLVDSAGFCVSFADLLLSQGTAPLLLTP